MQTRRAGKASPPQGRGRKGRGVSAALGILLAAWGAALPAQAQYAVDQSYTPDGTLIVTAGSGIGQSFTPTVRKIEAMNLWTRASTFLGGAGATLTLRIYDGEGFGGAVLGTSTPLVLPATYGGDAFALTQFEFTSTVHLIPGQSYTAEVSTGGVFWDYQAKISGAYSGGSAYEGGRAYTIDDLTFQTLYDATIAQYNTNLSAAVVSRSLNSFANIGQEFTASGSRIDYLQLLLADQGLPSSAAGTNVTVRVRDGSLTGAVLGTATAFLPRGYGQGGAQPGNQAEWTFPGGVALTPGQKYVLEIDTGGTPWGATGTLNDVYSGGRLLVDNGTTVAGDLWFRTYDLGIAAPPAAAPEPGALALALLPFSAVAMGGIVRRARSA